MLRTRYHPNIKVQPNVKLKGACTIINIVHNDINNKKNERNTLINNRSNKFLSIPERQRIIREINQSKNQINFQFNLDEPFKREKIEKKRSEDNKSLLYVKKVKSDLNYDKVPKSNSKIIKNNRNSKIGNFKFTDNREFVHKAIKEYYKKIDNSFKNYLHNLNNRSNDNKIKGQKSYFSNKNYINNSNNDNFSYLNNQENKNNKVNNTQNNKISINRDKNIIVNEIYKKPNLSRIYNKANVNNIAEENKNHIINENDNNNNNIYLDSFNFINSARKEKINCTKMINNKNGDKNFIFNKINNYNTTTFRNNSKNDKSVKMHFNNSKKSNNHLLSKNNSTSNFMTKINKFKRKNQNDDIINQTEINLKKKDFKDKYKLDIVQTTYYGENLNNNINDNIKSESNDNNFINEQNDNKILLYSNINDYNLNSNLKYTKKSIKNPIYFQNKKRLFKGNFMSNDLPKIIIENDTISFMSPYDNNDLKSNLNINQDRDAICIINNIDNKLLFKHEENPDNIFDNNINNILPEKRNNYKITEIKTVKRDKSLTFSLEESPNRDDNRKNRSFSYADRDNEKKDDNYNFIYKNRRHHYTYKKIYPSIKEKNVYKYNYIRHKSKCMRKEEIFFPNVKNRNKMNNYYNSDDDIMNSNSCNNSSNNILGGIKNKSFDFNCYNAINSNNNLFNTVSKNTLMKEYYFNYFSNKINNDFLDENKFNKFEHALLNKKSQYSKNKSNFGLSESIESYNNSYKNNTPLKSILNSYKYKKYNDKIKSIRDDKIINKRHNKTDLISNKIYLKTDINNDKYNPKKLSSNIKNLKNGSQFSKKLEFDFKNLNFDSGRITSDNLTNKNLKNEKEDKEPMKIQEIKIEKIRKRKEQNSDSINKEIVNINNKDIENKLEKANLLKENFQHYKNLDKDEMNNPINDEFIIKDSYSNNGNKIKSDINKVELKNEEEKEIKAQKNEEKIDDIIDNNIDISPIPTRNSFIKEDNDNIIYEKTETENNIKVETEDENNGDDNNIISNFEEPIKQNYSNTKLSSISLELLEYINIISPKNYFIVKNNILNLIINNEHNNETLFIDILYPIAINQTKYQPVYAKLCKDLDRYFNKKDKTKSIVRTQLMKYCKTNFKKIKTCLENINDIVNDINFIGELINVQMVSKKVGLQCLSHLVSKFNLYNTDEKLINKKEEKYLYLNCIINLLNKFGTCVYCYQKEKIRQDELSLFENEIKKNIDILKEIIDNKINEDIPSRMKYRLLKLINKSQNNWEISIYEECKNKLFSSLYDESNDPNKNNNIADDKSEDDNIIKNTSIFNLDKAEDIISKNKNKQHKSVSPFSNMTSSNSNLNIRKQRLNSNKSNINIHNKSVKIFSSYTTKFENNLKSFKIHMDRYKASDNFENWNDIDNLFYSKKILKSEIFKGIIEACKNIIKRKDDIYYVDLYIKIIFEYYCSYLNINDFNEIVKTVLEELSYIYNEELQKEENQFLKDIWTIIIYYLLQNKIMKMNDFNYFCKGYSKEIKTNIISILNEVCRYNLENGYFFLKEFKNTKLANMNKKIVSDIFQDFNY